MRRLSAAALLAAAALAGCSLTPKPQADPTEFFVLTARPVEARAGRRPVVELAEVEVPDYLRNPRMAARSGGNEIDYAEFKRWAEPLDKGAARALREGLAPAADLRPAPAPGAALKLKVRLLAFEGRRGDGAAVVEAAWELRGGQAPRRGRLKSTREGWDGKDYAQLARLESDALGDVCARLAGKLSPRGE
jgi:uncharacterized lipoprotein YmbA